MTTPIRIRQRSAPAPINSEAPSTAAQLVAVNEPDDPAEGLTTRAEPGQTASYGVGYGKPPPHTRFRAGQSGNPRGRPKGSRTMITILTHELDQWVTVRENGRTQRIRKRALIVKQLAKKAAEGDLKALAQIIRIESDGAARDQSTSNPNLDDAAFTSERDRTILEQFMATFGPGDAKPSDEDGGQGQ